METRNFLIGQMASNGCEVVVVEDDPIISWDLRKQLEPLILGGVIYLVTQEQARIYLRSNRPHLIITNFRLLDGWIEKSYYTALKSASQQMLILTGLSDERLYPDFASAGEHSFLHKPFTSLQLRNCLKHLLRR